MRPWYPGWPRRLGDDLNLDLKRKIFTVGVEKWLSNSLQFEASFRNEDKNGARLFGNGFQCTSGAAPSPTCPASGTQWALLMLPEPINSTTQQFEARLNFPPKNCSVGRLLRLVLQQPVHLDGCNRQWQPGQPGGQSDVTGAHAPAAQHPATADGAAA
jgi:hypothetical protein